jgi:hypothetical protein
MSDFSVAAERVLSNRISVYKGNMNKKLLSNWFMVFYPLEIVDFTDVNERNMGKRLSVGQHVYDLCRRTVMQQNF